MQLSPNLVNHAEKYDRATGTWKKEKESDSKETVRYPGFNNCKDPDRCVEFMIDIEKVSQFIQTTPGGLIARGATEEGRQNIREQIKRKYAADLKQILTEHPQHIKTMNMTPKEVEEWTPEKANRGIEALDVPGEYRAKK